MKILLNLPVNEFKGKTGDSVHISSLCEKWVSFGHDVHLVTLRSGTEKKSVTSSGVINYTLPFSLEPITGFSINSIKQIVKLPIILITSFLFSSFLLFKHDFDLVFVRYRPPFSSVSVFLSVIFKKFLVTKIAGTAVYDYLKLPFEKKMFNLLSNQTAFFISDNINMFNFFRKLIPNKKVVNIPPPISIPPLLVKSVKQKKSKFVVLYVSSFRKDEDVMKFILAANIVSQRNSSITFIMIGDGPTKSTAMNLSKKLKNSNLTFLDSISHEKIPYYLKNSDILVALYVSKYDAIPIKLLEYGAAGKPIITTKNIGDVFKNEVRTFEPKKSLFTVNSEVDSVVDAILTLYKNKFLRKTLAENMFNFVYEYFSIDVVSKKYLTIFNEISTVHRF